MDAMGSAMPRVDRKNPARATQGPIADQRQSSMNQDNATPKAGVVRRRKGSMRWPTSHLMVPSTARWPRASARQSSGRGRGGEPFLDCGWCQLACRVVAAPATSARLRPLAAGFGAAVFWPRSRRRTFSRQRLASTGLPGRSRSGDVGPSAPAGRGLRRGSLLAAVAAANHF